MKHLLLRETEHQLDPMQFAYRPKRGVEDATLFLLQNIYSHLDKSGTYVRLLFADFSSAFNTIEPHLLLQKLMKMGVNANVIRWIDAFMEDRPQYVTVNGTCSSVSYLSTGAPQGCVISPILFILYTNDCLCQSEDCVMIKFADDTVIAGLLRSSEEYCRKAVSELVEWCTSNYLYLNAKKTQELVIYLGKLVSVILHTSKP